jgi:hypothetical protein
MLEIRGCLDLLQEALGAELGPQDLHGDTPVVAEVVGKIDDRHSSGAELALDTVPAREGGYER